jgi:hypothetical protein
MARTRRRARSLLTVSAAISSARLALPVARTNPPATAIGAHLDLRHRQA